MGSSSSSSSSRISSISSGTADGTEEWGYTDVRPGTIVCPLFVFIPLFVLHSVFD
jgi:hypothetical protein